MTTRWVVSLPRTEVGALGGMRRLPRVEVCDEGQLVWLRGDGAEETLDRRLRAIAGARRFALLSDGQLQPAGDRVPLGYQPAGPWSPLANWLACALPAAAWPGEMGDRIALRLVRGTEVAPANLLLTSLAAWNAYGQTAPQVRLDRWTFAVDRRGQVIVRGSPLPPLPGQPFVEMQGIAIPAGWQWLPAVDAETVGGLLGLDAAARRAGDLAVWYADGSWESVPADCFVRASRSAIRLTAETHGNFR